MNHLRTTISIAAVCVFAAIGCRPTAPSVASGPPVVSWLHLSSEVWRYELQDPKRIMNYSFGKNGGVLWSEGTKTGDVHSVIALGGQWYIDQTGNLIITDMDHAEAYRTMKLLALSKTTAILLDLDTGLTEHYSRRYFR